MASDRKILELHGTQLLVLTPSSIWGAAENDLRSREHNQALHRGDRMETDYRMRQFAFHRDHVRDAKTPNDVIRAALKDPAPGHVSGKRNTRLIYSNLKLLAEALK